MSTLAPSPSPATTATPVEVQRGRAHEGEGGRERGRSRERGREREGGFEAAGHGAGPRWEHFDHGADIGVRGIAPSKAQAFEQAALALVAVAVAPSQVAPLRTVALSCSASDDESLLVAWLNAVVYEMATRHMLFHDFSVALSDHRLQARARGEPLRAGHQAAVEVKGATYTALAVTRHEGRWVAQAVVDV